MFRILAGLGLARVFTYWPCADNDDMSRAVQVCRILAGLGFTRKMLAGGTTTHVAYIPIYLAVFPTRRCQWSNRVMWEVVANGAIRNWLMG